MTVRVQQINMRSLKRASTITANAQPTWAALDNTHKYPAVGHGRCLCYCGPKHSSSSGLVQAYGFEKGNVTLR